MRTKVLLVEMIESNGFVSCCSAFEFLRVVFYVRQFGLYIAL